MPARAPTTPPITGRSLRPPESCRRVISSRFTVVACWPRRSSMVVASQRATTPSSGDADVEVVTRTVPPRGRARRSSPRSGPAHTKLIAVTSASLVRGRRIELPVAVLVAFAESLGHLRLRPAFAHDLRRVVAQPDVVDLAPEDVAVGAPHHLVGLGFHHLRAPLGAVLDALGTVAEALRPVLTPLLAAHEDLAQV